MPECKSNNSCYCGPGYESPLAAMKYGPREKIVYTICIQTDHNKPDYLATIDVDPESPTYSQVIHRLKMPNLKDELHHFGWNICSSCYGDANKSRNKMVIPALGSDRVYIVDTSANPKAPTLFKVIEPEKMQAFGASTPHTIHCLASGEVMISVMGDPKGDALGDFILIDSSTWEIKGLWTKGKQANFGYDFWYQPYWDIMVASEWGAPKSFKKGYTKEDTYNPKLTGRSLNFYSWKDRTLLQSIDLGEEGIAPLEVRFLHDPKATQGFVGCAVNANIFRFYRKEDGTWDAVNAIDIPAKKVEVEGGESSEIQGMVSDILISLDDKYLYLSNWLHGDVRQYDISDSEKPKLAGQVFLGGKVLKGSPIKVIHDSELKEQPEPVYIKGKRIYGGPQMLQLSLDGKRLYVTTSLFSPWDRQIYPDMITNGSVMMKLDVDHENGGLKLDENFLIDFGAEPDGPVLSHETRYPGGDCTSDIWLAK